MASGARCDAGAGTQRPRRRDVHAAHARRNVGRRGARRGAEPGSRQGVCAGVTEGGQGVARERRARMVGATLGVRSARSEPNTWHAMNSGI